MRPSLLDPLFAPISSLPGIGERTGRLFARAVEHAGDEPRIVDLIFHLPHSIIDRTSRPVIADAPDGAIVTLEVVIDSHQPPPRGRPNVPYRVFAHDETDELAIVFFRVHGNWPERSLPVGESVVVSGRMERFNGRPSMVHPDHVALAADAGSLPLIEPVYPSSAGLSAKLLRKSVLEALARLPVMPEWIDRDLAAREGFPGFREALHSCHKPERPAADLLSLSGRRRLAYDEFLAGQLSLGLVRARVRRIGGRSLIGDGSKLSAIRSALPYSLTASQEAALAEIVADLSKPEQMLRLLQGDVGAGKTIVALLAMARAAEAGTQSALMAPTEVLARQHLATIAPLAAHAGMKAVVLTGREKGEARARILREIADGSVDIVIGTHALFQESVTYRDLGLAIVDEQHRFGVHQRLAITAKGVAPDMLVMTATPIPRTLVLTAFGDMDVSRLSEKPAGRRPIRTVTLPDERMPDLLARLRQAIDGGGKAYWICPLVEESPEAGLMSVEERHALLSAEFGEIVGLVHGRMKAADKDGAMAAFRDGTTRVLVATTVVEVGVDVPDATIIVIEHAERFGLAQLHQLRGRVGRGNSDSSCVLLYAGPLGETARQRLAIMRDTEDGFVIAEEDLRLRGEGELLGTRQSGTPGFRVARIEAHADLLAMARQDARLALERDPDLLGERGQALRLLLYLFGRDEAVRLLRAG